MENDPSALTSGPAFSVTYPRELRLIQHMKEADLLHRRVEKVEVPDDFYQFAGPMASLLLQISEKGEL